MPAHCAAPPRGHPPPPRGHPPPPAPPPFSLQLRAGEDLNPTYLRTCSSLQPCESAPTSGHRPYLAGSRHARLRLLNARSAQTCLSSPPPVISLSTSLTARSRLLAALATTPAPSRQPLIGPNGIAEVADWRGRRRSRALWLRGGRRGARTRRSLGEPKRRGTWRSTTRAGKPRPFLLWLSRRGQRSRIWAGEVLSRDRDKAPGIASPLATGLRGQRPDGSEIGCQAHLRLQASLGANTLGLLPGGNLFRICNLTHPGYAGLSSTELHCFLLPLSHPSVHTSLSSILAEAEALLHPPSL